eukprot:357308-Chlamydomonas_euryale.AAC.10
MPVALRPPVVTLLTMHGTLLCIHQVEIVDAERYRYDGECLIKAQEMGHPGIVNITQKQIIALADLTQDEFIFRVESTGALSAEAIVRQAIDIMLEKINSIGAAVREVQASSMETSGHAPAASGNLHVLCMLPSSRKSCFSRHAWSPGVSNTCSCPVVTDAMLASAQPRQL